MTDAGRGVRRVVIAGGGPAALETALALQQLTGGGVAITLVAPEPELVYRPLSVAQPFGGEPPRRFSLRALAAERGFELLTDTVARVDPAHRTMTTGAGSTVGYDALVLAIGARPVEAIPGAMLFSGPADIEPVRAALAGLPRDRAPRVAFVAGAATAWTLPIYELALLAATWAADRDVALDPWLVTYESRPLAIFGGQASRETTKLLEQAGVRLWTSAHATLVEDGRLWLDMEGGLPVHRAIALPRLTGRPIPGIPHDAEGFIPVDALGRVTDTPDVYAVGDVTTWPLKQGGLASQQADATATALAAWAGADVQPAPYRPELRAVLLTGREPRYLRQVGGAGRRRSEVATEPPWWPPHKIVARHLAPYLAAHPELEVRAGPAG